MLINKLRDYQKEAHDLMVAKKGFYNADDMGLGKTLTTLAAIDTLKALPCIIVVPKFGLMVWQDEIEKWLDEPSIIYSGKPQEREEQWRIFHEYGFKFLITNYALFPEVALRSGIDIKNSRTAIKTPTGTFAWQSIIFDEAHMGGLFNQKTSTFKAADKFCRNIPTRFILTGTPIRQGVVDLYGPLHLIAPKIFDSYWKFVNKYCTIIQGPFGRSIERNPSDIASFRTMLKHFMVRRVKDEVAKELPGKLRQVLPVKMTTSQHTIYHGLVRELLAEIPETGELLITPSQMVLQTRLRQILTCPRVLGMPEDGAALEAIIEHSHTSLDDGKPIVIFTPFKKAVPFIQEALEDEYNDIEIYTITGGLTSAQFGAAWQGFQKSRSSRRVLICVIKSGASFQATTAATAYFLGYEWDFNLNEQAEDRLNRIGQTAFVNIYYTMHKGTVDEQVAAVLNAKKSSNDWIVGTEKQYLEKLRQLHSGK